MINTPFPGNCKTGLMLLGDIFTSLRFTVQPEGLCTCTKHRKSVQKYKIKSNTNEVSQGIFQLSIFLEYLDKAYMRELHCLDALVTPLIRLYISGP